MSLAVVLRWDGPYSIEEAGKLGAPGIYAVWGRHRMGPDPKQFRFLYCGISENQWGVGARVKQHGGREFDHYKNEWWIGRVRAPAEGWHEALHAAEWLITAFSRDYPRFAKKKLAPPTQTCAVINEWFRRSGTEILKAQGLLQVIPDVLSWDHERKRLLVADRLRAHRHW